MTPQTRAKADKQANKQPKPSAAEPGTPEFRGGLGKPTYFGVDRISSDAAEEGRPRF